MQETDEPVQATVPEQPVTASPIQRGKPLLWVFITLALLFIAYNAIGSFSRSKDAAKKSTLTAKPETVNPQQVSGFASQQSFQAKQDALRALQQQQAAALGAQGVQRDIPGPEADGVTPMTPQQRQAIYGASPNAPQRTSGASEAQAQAKQAALARAKAAQDARNSDTVAIDFAHAKEPASTSVAQGRSLDSPAAEPAPVIQGAETAEAKLTNDPKKGLGDSLDTYDGKLYRVFEGNVFEGIVTNHINGSLAGPILIMLTTDYYSHDHQQLLLPQGTRLIGEVKPVTGQQQTRLAVVFHRAICPDGFNVDLEKYAGLDPLGTTGISGHVDHGYLQAFGAAAAVGVLGGVAQIGNSGSILTPSAEIRNGVSEQTSEEGEQVLNHFLNRLPIITLKEGSRARVYISRDMFLPAYANHHVDPTL